MYTADNKHEYGSVIIGTCFRLPLFTVNPLHIIEGIMDRFYYKHMLKDMLPFVE